MGIPLARVLHAIRCVTRCIDGHPFLRARQNSAALTPDSITLTLTQISLVGFGICATSSPAQASWGVPMLLRARFDEPGGLGVRARSFLFLEGVLVGVPADATLRLSASDAALAAASLFLVDADRRLSISLGNGLMTLGPFASLLVPPPLPLRMPFFRTGASG